MTLALLTWTALQEYSQWDQCRWVARSLPALRTHRILQLHRPGDFRAFTNRTHYGAVSADWVQRGFQRCWVRCKHERVQPRWSEPDGGGDWLCDSNSVQRYFMSCHAVPCLIGRQMMTHRLHSGSSAFPYALISAHPPLLFLVLYITITRIAANSDCAQTALWTACES